MLPLVCKSLTFKAESLHFNTLLHGGKVALSAFIYRSQVARCGKLFTSLQTSTQKTRRDVSIHISAFARRSTLPSTILLCSSISQRTHQRAHRWPQTLSLPFTLSWPQWRKLWRCIGAHWSQWRTSYVARTWCGSPGCSPAAPQSRSSVSASCTSKLLWRRHWKILAAV